MAVQSSIPAAIDYLVAEVAALPECAAPVVVADGWADARGDTSVVIGITPEDPDTANEPIHAEVGAQTEWEIYEIPCILWCRVGGSDMKVARDGAFTVFDAIGTLIRADRTLGGALHSGTAQLASWRVAQTPAAPQAGDGRVCEIRFVVRCKNRSTA